jgi:hypothetical protein
VTKVGVHNEETELAETNEENPAPGRAALTPAEGRRTTVSLRPSSFAFVFFVPSL